MTRARKTQWGVTFRVSGCPDGYRWSDHDELLPTPSGGDAPSLHLVHMEGFEVCREAMRAFVRFGRQIEGGVEVTGEAGDQLRANILQFAGFFGTLFGGEPGRQDPRTETLHDWLVEGATFLALYDISRTLRSARRDKFREFSERVFLWPSDPHILAYRSGQFYAPDLFITDPVDEAGPVSGDIINLTTRTATGGPHAQAMALLARYVTAKTHGGLNFEPSRFQPNQFVIVPKNLIAMLYVRLWMDTIDAEEPDRECIVCGETVEGNRGKQFCSQACKQRHWRERRTRTLA